MAKPKLALIVHNVRSCHNVGSLLRTGDGLGIDHIYLTGYTPYPYKKNDRRLPHIGRRISNQIHKTALGAENSTSWSYHEKLEEVLAELRQKGYLIAALEQTSHARSLIGFQAAKPLALIVGSEVGGLEESILQNIKLHLQIPMRGKKESFNVAIAAAIALYHLRYEA